MKSVWEKSVSLGLKKEKYPFKQSHVTIDDTPRASREPNVAEVFVNILLFKVFILFRESYAVTAMTSDTEAGIF